MRPGWYWAKRAGRAFSGDEAEVVHLWRDPDGSLKVWSVGNEHPDDREEWHFFSRVDRDDTPILSQAGAWS